jgi:hypothetical protein
MKRSLPFVVSMLFASAALAEPSADPKGVGALVDARLVTPLKGAEGKRKKFSRAMPAPTARRVRVLEESATDPRGREFVRFAIDVHRPWTEEGTWELDSVVGCAYAETREVYVRNGDTFVPAKHLLGQAGKAPRGVCSAAPAGETLAAAPLAKTAP